MKTVPLKLDDDYIRYLDEASRKQKSVWYASGSMNRSEYLRMLIYDDAKKNEVSIGHWNARGRNATPMWR